MCTSQAVIEEFAQRLQGLGWVRDLWVTGATAPDDYHPGISEINLIAVTDVPVGKRQRRQLKRLHRQIDAGPGKGLGLSCLYVDHSRLLHSQLEHPAWQSGHWIHRTLSPLDRAELGKFGSAIFGRAPEALFPPNGSEMVRAAVRDSLRTYWLPAVHQRRVWRNQEFADLSLIMMARARHALATGELITKDAAIEEIAGPDLLKQQVRERRSGTRPSGRRLRLARIARRDARDTIQEALA